MKVQKLTKEAIPVFLAEHQLTKGQVNRTKGAAGTCRSSTHPNTGNADILHTCRLDAGHDGLHMKLYDDILYYWVRGE